MAASSLDPARYFRLTHPDLDHWFDLIVHEHTGRLMATTELAGDSRAWAQSTRRRRPSG